MNTIVYVTEQGAEVGIKRARLEVRKGRTVLQSIRFEDLSQIVLCGNVQVSVQAMRALLRAGVDTTLLTLGGAFLGRLTGPMGKNVELRRLQHRLLDKPEITLDLARRIVRGKLGNSRAFLQRYQRTRKDERIAKALVSIRLLSERLEDVDDLDALRGFEGKAAADYFACFPALLVAPGMEFHKRIRRPPPDPVNILLSLGYTLLGNLVQGAVEFAGLDPYLGSLHAPLFGRPSLPLDLMEEMRPVVVDAAVVQAVNRRVVVPNDFVPASSEEAPIEDAWEREEAEGVDRPPRRTLIFRQEGIKRWITAFERRLGESAYYPPQDRKLTYRQIIREQVYRFCRHLKDEEEYESYTFKA